MAFQKATKKTARLRMALIGPSGSGKTYTALMLANGLGSRVAVIDTEHGSASKYADEWGFDTMELTSFHPQRYIEGIKEAEQAGYDVLIIDSLSHAWMGKDGALELVDKAAKRSQSNNSFAAWRDVTPLHNTLIDTILAAHMHIIVTIRAKTEYVQEKDEKGRTVVRKVGLAPIQKDGTEYEMDIVADMDLNNTMIISKSRCRALTGAVVDKPTAALAETIKAWLSDGETFDPAPARSAIAALPDATDADKAAAAALTDRDELAKLFREVKARGERAAQQSADDSLEADYDAIDAALAAGNGHAK